MVTLQASPTTPTEAQLQATRQRIDAYIQTLASHPDRREGALPYYLFHDANTPIKGTVLMFHGFSAKPHQMSRLADYLFRNGFNVYQATLAGHAYRIPDQYWPQVDLKPEILIPLRQKVDADPVLQTFLTNMATASEGGAVSPTPVQMMGLVARLRQLEPRLLDIIAAIEKENAPEFDRYFVSSHLDYLRDGQSRLSELEAMPGPVYTVGLSVGGAVALALGAKNPQRVAKVVAFAPLLEVYGETRERYVNLAGPLDIREFGWDDLQFPLGCFTAANQFGAFVRKNDNVAALRPKPTLMILTENEDAADLQTNQSFARSLTRASLFKRYDNHYLYTFPSAALVPHPMVDPLEKSQNMRNGYWKPMYQETLRFLTQTEFRASSLEQIGEVPGLPAVPPI
ncbi:alpha/beta fold hydrolase [Nodosilinea sp. LEGE 07298]|uniref:alpha/beta hydrolase-fold protein n=1 Tax=Nodosilinea sp. LEGE 07298 TaxID=2777970 RepID=UPI00187F6BDA|nr:alpha/beta hydrolase-fold protein [Nodosilinea sp. LEGE 07298]MBE9110924.1 alpha/beta fold hydrolase [Nodosilinea sp. LEGE 07298]